MSKDKELNPRVEEYLKRESNNKNNQCKGAGNIKIFDDEVDNMRKICVRYNVNEKLEIKKKNAMEVKSITEKFLKERTMKMNKAFLSMKEHRFSNYALYFASSEEQRKNCIFTISSPSTIHADGTGGFFDTRLGPLKKKQECSSCLKTYSGCDGHKAWLDFKTEIPNPLTADKDFLNTAKCICWCCETPFADEEYIEISELRKKFSGEKYREALAEHSVKLRNKHSHQGYVHEDFQKVVEGRLCYSKKEGKRTSVIKAKNMQVVFKVFQALSKDRRSLKILGFDGETKPVNYIMTGMCVIPPRLRRPGFVNGAVSDHSLTDKYLDIYLITAKIETTQDQSDKRGLISCLYNQVKELFEGMKKTYKKTDKGVIQLLSNKTGFIRRHAMGKRVNGSVRTVVGPLTEADLDQYGVPQEVCDKQFAIEIINRYNYELMLKRYKLGIFKYATVIFQGVEQTIRIDDKPAFIPQIGNKLWRCLQNDDLILFGRQPTLHGESIMASRVLIREGITFKLHEANTSALNCDFDGDENTIHVMFTNDALIELMTSSNVTEHIANLESNKPMIAPAFHALLMSYVATEKWVYPSETGVVRKEEEQEIDYIKRMRKAMEESEVFHELTIPERRFPEILCCIKHSHRTRTYLKRCQKNGLNHLSGRALLSLAFPTNLYYSGKDLKIVDGLLVSGVFKSSNIGKKHGSLVQVIYKLYSQCEAARFISDFTKLTDWLLMYKRFSIGEQSFSTNRKEIKRTLNPELNKLQAEFFSLGEEPENPFDKFHWKKKCHSITDQNLVFSKNVGNAYFLPNNDLNILSGNGSGGKGSDMNTAQITAFLGPQKIQGDFQRHEFNNGKRLLPTFLPGDNSLEAFGIITNSFYDGLRPSEAFVHFCASREGLINTAIKVSEAGSSRREIEKSVENNIVDYCGRIASMQGRIYSFTNPVFSPAMSVYVDHPRHGRILSFCDFKDQANFVRGIHEYIEKYMEPEGLEEDTEEEFQEEKEYEFEIQIQQQGEINNQLDNDNGFDEEDFGED